MCCNERAEWQWIRILKPEVRAVAGNEKWPFSVFHSISADVVPIYNEVFRGPAVAGLQRAENFG